MNEQDILNTLMRNPEFKKALKELLLHNKDLSSELGLGTTEKNVYVWCAEMTDVAGGVFYHPIIAPESTMMMPDIDYMMNVDNYSMMASENQFEAYRYEPMVKMFNTAYRSIPVRLIAVPVSTFNKLEEALVALVSNIIEEVSNCFDHLDRIAAMTNTPADIMKMQLLMSVFGHMTTVAACFDREMTVQDSTDHDYCNMYETDSCDDYDDFDDYDDYD
jgi:hypothetical protein